eukprot:11528727-Karenia_brevis.AAC.1
MVSAHMDDLKATRAMDLLRWFHLALKKYFGDDVKMVCSAEFIHTGIRHRVSQNYEHVRLDQEEYVLSLKLVTSSLLSSLRDDDP